MAQPTSRKKYYLQVSIAPQWTDGDFLPDLCKHIESNSAKSLRDIFINNSSRMGCFSVKAKQIAERLLTSFSTNNISCRGRKPQAKITQISSTNFQIQLKNLNNIITSTEFMSWILSLNYDSFDIQLFDTKIFKGSEKCILAFNTIDTAIHVKSKLQNKQFRGTRLYFTHWHVPRRNISSISVGSTAAAKPGKIGVHSGVVLGLVDQDHACSGYSTGTKSGTTSPIDNVANGPLYLRDPSVPPPPHRSPPIPPPVPVTAPRIVSNHSNISNGNGVQSVSVALAPNYGKYCISFEEEMLSNEANKMYVNSLYQQLEKQKLMIRQLMHDKNQALLELDEQKNFNKHINDKYSLLYNKYVSLHNLNTVLLWNCNDVIAWIMKLENGIFIKYKEYLIYSMNSENVNGSMLSKLNKLDLHRLGITDCNDIYLLLKHINNLLSN